MVGSKSFETRWLTGVHRAGLVALYKMPGRCLPVWSFHIWTRHPICPHLELGLSSLQNSKKGLFLLFLSHSIYSDSIVFLMGQDSYNFYLFFIPFLNYYGMYRIHLPRKLFTTKQEAAKASVTVYIWNVPKDPNLVLAGDGRSFENWGLVGSLLAIWLTGCAPEDFSGTYLYSFLSWGEWFGPSELAVKKWDLTMDLDTVGPINLRNREAKVVTVKENWLSRSNEDVKKRECGLWK